MRASMSGEQSQKDDEIGADRPHVLYSRARSVADALQDVVLRPQTTISYSFLSLVSVTLAFIKLVLIWMQRNKMGVTSRER